MSKDLHQPFLIFSVAGCALAACASVPSFQPSQPLAEARGLRESLLLCDEYRMPDPSSRPADLKPYLECVDRTVEIQKPRGLSPVYDFQQEIHQTYDLMRDAHWTPRMAVDLENSIHSMLRALAAAADDPGQTPPLQDLASNHFPRTLQRLGLTRSGVKKRDSRLEALRNGVVKKLAAEPALRDDRGCQRLQEELDYLDSLWNDRMDLENLARAQGVAGIPDPSRLRPSNADLESLAAKYEARLRKAEEMTRECPQNA